MKKPKKSEVTACVRRSLGKSLSPRRALKRLSKIDIRDPEDVPRTKERKIRKITDADWALISRTVHEATRGLAMRDTQSIGRALFPVDDLPPGAFARHEKDAGSKKRDSRKIRKSKL